MGEALNFVDANVFRAASGLACGVGLMGDGCCGAYLGGAIMVSLLVGRELSDLEDTAHQRTTAYDLTHDLHDRFVAKYGSVVCQHVQHAAFGRSFNLREAADKVAFEAAGAHIDKCPSVVANACQWTVEILGSAGKL